MKIGAQLYNCREYCKTPEAIEATLRRVKQIGFDVVQFSGFGPCDPEPLARWVKELELEVCLTHAPWARLAGPDELKKLAAEHRLYGCNHIGLGMKPEDVFPNSREGWTRFIKKANQICAILKNEGMFFGYHNHEMEFQKWDGVTVMDRLIEECPDMFFIPDTFWVQAGGANPVKYIQKLSGRIKVIHFKDFRVVNRTRQFAEIGEGNLDWDAILSACEEGKIPCAVIEQDADFLRDPFESLSMSLQFLKKKTAGAFLR